MIDHRLVHFHIKVNITKLVLLNTAHTPRVQNSLNIKIKYFKKMEFKILLFITLNLIQNQYL